MANPLFTQFGGGSNTPTNPLFSRIKQFQQMFSGNPQQMVQQMLNSGKISQTQMNQYVQQTNQIYNQFKDFM